MSINAKKKCNEHNLKNDSKLFRSDLCVDEMRG